MAVSTKEAVIGFPYNFGTGNLEENSSTYNMFSLLFGMSSFIQLHQWIVNLNGLKTFTNANNFDALWWVCMKFGTLLAF